jgi:hypothetical protein
MQGAAISPGRVGPCDRIFRCLRGSRRDFRVRSAVSGLSRRFQTSQTPQDYRDVGIHGVGVLEALSRTVDDPSKHKRPSEDVPPVDKTTAESGTA